MITFKILVLWIHLLAVMIWLGGLFFFAIVVMPALRKSLRTPGEFFRLAEKVLSGFDAYSKEVIGVIVLTGIFNLINTGWLRRFHFSSDYWWLLSFKLGIFCVMIALHLVLRRSLIPGLALLAEQENHTAERARLYRKYLVLIALLLMLAAVAVLMGLALRGA